MITVNRDIVKGVLIGVGVSAVAFYAYKKNENKVDNFMRDHGMTIESPKENYAEMSLVDLMRTKETLEDLIAEKEIEENTVTATEADAEEE